MLNTLLEGNVFTNNSSQSRKPVVDITNFNELTASQLDGESKRSIVMLNNSFEDNGSHGTGVVAIEAMPNVEISGDNVFSSNTDSVDFNAAVLY